MTENKLCYQISYSYNMDKEGLDAVSRYLFDRYQQVTQEFKLPPISYETFLKDNLILTNDKAQLWVSQPDVFDAFFVNSAHAQDDFRKLGMQKKYCLEISKFTTSGQALAYDFVPLAVIQKHDTDQVMHDTFMLIKSNFAKKIDTYSSKIIDKKAREYKNTEQQAVDADKQRILKKDHDVKIKLLKKYFSDIGNLLLIKDAGAKRYIIGYNNDQEHVGKDEFVFRCSRKVKEIQKMFIASLMRTNKQYQLPYIQIVDENLRSIYNSKAQAKREQVGTIEKYKKTVVESGQCAIDLTPQQVKVCDMDEYKFFAIKERTHAREDVFLHTFLRKFFGRKPSLRGCDYLIKDFEINGRPFISFGFKDRQTRGKMESIVGQFYSYFINEQDYSKSDRFMKGTFHYLNSRGELLPINKKYLCTVNIPNGSNVEQKIAVELEQIRLKLGEVYSFDVVKHKRSNQADVYILNQNASSKKTLTSDRYLDSCEFAKRQIAKIKVNSESIMEQQKR